MTGLGELGESTRSTPRESLSPPLQPWGSLLLISADWRIDGVSSNVRQIVGPDANELLGHPLASVFNAAIVHALRNRLALLGGSGGSERLCNQPLTDGGRLCDLLLHLAGSRFVAEIFPASDPEGIDVSAMAGRMADWLEGCSTLDQLGDKAVHAIRGVTGCDYVCVWKAMDGHAHLLASYARPDFDHPPPPPAITGGTRFIADCHSEPATLLLRDGVSPPPLEASLLGGGMEAFKDYVCANEAGSGLLIPVSVDGRPWGSIIGLNRGERQLGIARLSVVELFAKFFAAEVRRLEALD